MCEATTIVHFNVTAEEKLSSDFSFFLVSEMKSSPWIHTCGIKCGWRLVETTALYISVCSS